MSSNRQHRIDTAALIWSLTFLGIAGLGIWVAHGGTPPATPIRWLIPLLLIGLGVTGLVLNRHRN